MSNNDPQNNISPNLSRRYPRPSYEINQQNPQYYQNTNQQQTNQFLNQGMNNQMNQNNQYQNPNQNQLYNNNQQNMYQNTNQNQMNYQSQQTNLNRNFQNVQISQNNLQQQQQQQSQVAQSPNTLNQKLFEYRTDGDKIVPPPTSSNFIAIENKNCSPRFMRSSLYSVPQTKMLHRSTTLPFGVVVQPLAITHPSEDFVPVVDFGENGPIRCTRCGAYISSFSTFGKGGKIWICPICEVDNAVPKDYFCALDSNNLRRDLSERPELYRGTVEFVAKKEKGEKNEKIKEQVIHPPHYILLIEVSSFSRQGIFSKISETLKNSIENFPENSYVSVITFDSTIHFYDFSKGEESEPDMIIMSDVNDVFLPISSSAIKPISQIKDQLTSFFENLPENFPKSSIKKGQISSFGAAIKAATLLLEKTGGKIITFSTQLPTKGMGLLKKRDNPKLWGKVGEKKLLIAQGNYYLALGQWCLNHNIVVDQFVFRATSLELTTTSDLSRITGGEIYYYRNFVANIDGEKMLNDITWLLKRPTGFNCICRLRTSTGIRISKSFGNFQINNEEDDIKVSSIDSDKALTFLLEHDMDLNNGQPVYLQFAMLYTTINMQKRIRIINLKLNSSSNIKNIFDYIDQETLMNIVAKQSVNQLQIFPLNQIRENIIQQIVNILYTYRKFCAERVEKQRMVVPSNLQLIPIYSLCLTKSKLFRTYPSIPVDEKVSLAHYIRSSSVKLSSLFMYPRLYPLHNFQKNEGLFSESNQKIMLPNPLKLSVESLSSQGVLIIENGIEMYLWLGQNVSLDLIGLLLNVEINQSTDISRLKLPKLNNTFSKKVNNIIQEISQNRSKFPSLRILRHGMNGEINFLQFLIQDKFKSVSYMEFLSNIHKMIIEKMK
ncbi:sec24-related protein [Anaeramoeba flamelloides]|uniref:Sec24-related protein n=1 Tax=Anaeramoeba flamelloides TaxID=1746091 RepID=A0ABQ8Y5S2_9EUKA|nr:sec24-related protein [Anaeramoeba flamelloides]